MERRSVPLPPHAFGTAATKMPRSGMVQATASKSVDSICAAVLKIGNALPRRSRITPSRVDVHVGLAGDVLGASAWRYA